MPLFHSVPNLLREGKLEEAVWRTETALLNYRPEAERLLEQIPIEALAQSPLLMKAYGERCFLGGRLAEAEQSLELAVKGFAKLSFAQQLTSAMSMLTIVRLHLGRRDEAATMLQFLRDEYAHGETAVDGWLPLALASGCRAKGEEEKCAALYEASWELFIAGLDLRSGAFVLWEALLGIGEKLSPEEWERWTIRARRLGNGLYEHHAYSQLILAIRCSHEQKWTDAAAAWHEAALPVCGFRHQTMLQIHRLKSSFLSGQSLTGEQIGWLHGKAEQHDDLELRFQALETLFIHCFPSGNYTESKQLIDRAKAIHSELRQPRLKLAIASMESKWSEAEKKPARVPEASVEGWKVRCFGGLQFNRCGIEIASLRWKRKKAQELLVYLLLQPQYTAVKEVAVDALFPETKPDKLGNQWYVVIHQLKQVFKTYLGSEDALITKDRLIRLNPALIEQVDVEKFAALVKVADELWLTDRDIAAELYEEAEQLYGELVPELQYADWLEAVKETVLEKNCGVLKKLVAYALSRGDHERAEHYLKKWIALRPFLEEAYQELLSVLMTLGRKAEARDWYRKLERALQLEFNVAPATETKRILAI